MVFFPRSAINAEHAATIAGHLLQLSSRTRRTLLSNIVATHQSDLTVRPIAMWSRSFDSGSCSVTVLIFPALFPTAQLAQMGKKGSLARLMAPLMGKRESDAYSAFGSGGAVFHMKLARDDKNVPNAW